MGRHIKARELVVLKLKRKFMLNMGRGSNYFKNLRDTDLQHLLISSMSRYQKKVMVLLARRKNKTLRSFSQHQLEKSAWSGPWLAARQKELSHQLRPEESYNRSYYQTSSTTSSGALTAPHYLNLRGSSNWR